MNARRIPLSAVAKITVAHNKPRRISILIAVAAVLSLLTLPVFAQVQRDSSGIAAITSAITGMGGLPPQDSIATANATMYINGASTQVGVQIKTRGLNQTAEQFSLPSGTQALIYSQGFSNEKSPDAKPGQDPFSFELSLTAQSPMFPLPWLAARYANTDVAVENLGNETQAGITTSHVRLTNTFSSNPDLKHYSSLTVCEVWFDATTGLPIRIKFERRNAGGSVAGIPVTYEYSDYRNVQGFLYPFHIRKYLNGPLSADIVVQSVSFNAGISATAFAID